MEMFRHNTSIPELPQKVLNLLRTISHAADSRNQYGTNHPKSIENMRELDESIESYFGIYESLNCIFTRNTVIVNDLSYKNTHESTRLMHQLRMRGVLAITIIKPVFREQIEILLDFLLADPVEIKQTGGPNEYFRKRDITCIIPTEAANIQNESVDEISDHDALSTSELDDAVGEVVDWLSNKDAINDTDAAIGLLKNTDYANSLINEAVTALRKSNNEYADGHLINEILYDLKTMSAVDKDKWDAAISQIRKSVSRLPMKIRPLIPGFTGADAETSALKRVHISDIEPVIEQLMTDDGVISVSNIDYNSADISYLFSIKTDGLLSRWHAELEPSGILSACSRTYDILMRRSDTAEEHLRIVNAIAALSTRATESGNNQAAINLLTMLLGEAKYEGSQEWRNINAKDVLGRLSISVLSSLISDVLHDNDYHLREVAAGLVEFIPGLALNLIHLLGVYRSEPFDKYIQSGIKRSGDRALIPLIFVLDNGSVSARESAIEIMLDIGSILSLGELATVIEGKDEHLACMVLNKLNGTLNSRLIQACHNSLSSPSLDIRLAAINTVGRVEDRSAIPDLIKIAGNSSVNMDNNEERICAIQVIGQIGSDEEILFLKKIVESNPIIGRKQHEEIRATAEDAVNRIQIRTGSVMRDISQLSGYSGEQSQ